MDTQESSGTNKLFDLLAPFFLVLKRGGRLIVDELDTKLHPLLTKALIKLFHNPDSNLRNAQLIFATHDTNLLSDGSFRRDQIYFTEKNRVGATDLYSLVDYKQEEEGKVDHEAEYIQGRYGGIPYLGNISDLFKKWQEGKSTMPS